MTGREMAFMLASIVAGASAAVATTLVMSRSHVTSTASNSQIQPSLSQVQNREVAWRVEDTESSQSLEAMARRLEKIENDSKITKSIQATSDSKPTDPSSDEIRAADTIRHQQEHHQRLESHLQEPIDLVWSREARTSLLSDMQTLEGKFDFKTQDVDCRTNTCTVNTVWENFDRAHDSIGKMAEHAFQINCERRITLMPASEGEAKYQTTIIFTCDRSQLGLGCLSIRGEFCVPRDEDGIETSTLLDIVHSHEAPEPIQLLGSVARWTCSL